jgi:lysophospholipid acyltransferase
MLSIDVNHHLFPPTDGERAFAQKIGFTITMLRFCMAFLLSVPVAAVFRVFPRSVTGRHIYAIVTGFCLLYFPFGTGMVHFVVSSAVVYCLMLAAPYNCGKMTWIFAFSYLIMNHVKQTSGLSWKEGNLDFTGAQMVATLKLISVAVCYQDGFRTRTNDKAALAQLHPYARFKMLESRPTLLEFYSYLLSIGSLLSGPCYEFKDYMDYIERRGDWKRIPNPTVPGLMRFCKALVCGAVWMYFTNHLKLNVDFVEGTYWREEMHLIPRIFVLWFVVVAYRFKYYAVWTVSECMMIFSGFGYRRRKAQDAAQGMNNGKMEDSTRDEDWDRYATSHIRQVELNPSIADTPRHWNICTGLWLRHYVYERLTRLGGKPSFVNMMVTQLVSGVWHGLLPGYWLFFATSAFIFQASRVIFKYEQNWPSKWRNFYPWYVVKVLTTGLVLNYAGSAFMVLELDMSLQIWRATYYFGHVWMIFVLLVGQVFPPSTKKKDT